MKPTETPQPHRDSRVRSALKRAELVRYWWEYRGRVRAILRARDPKNAVRLDAGERRAIREFWRRYGVSYVNPDWYRLFKVLSGTVDPRFVPEETFRTRLEPYLCRRDVSAAYHDKNQLERLLPDLPQPLTVLRNIYGEYFDAGYNPVDRRDVTALLAQRSGVHFVKPAISGTGSGYNVARVELTPAGFVIGGAVWSLADVERAYIQDFVVQEGVRQHASVARFHPTSLNTLRVITLRHRGVIRPLAVTLRVGNGSHVDNGHAGGLLSGVNLANGRAGQFACDVSFQRFERHPLSGEAFADAAIPSFEGVLSLATSAHWRLAYFDVLSCDIAVHEDGTPWLIEVNTFGQGVEPHQFLQNGPLFGDDTDTVLALVAHRRAQGWNS